MKAVWYEKTGKSEDVLQIGEMECPTPEPGEVRVRLHASGINPSDVKTRAGARGALAFPKIIPHSDGAGIIDAVGKNVSEERIGERVWIYNAAWKRAEGTAAQFVTVPVGLTVPLPENTLFEEAACFGIPAMTAHRVVFSEGSVKGKTVLITGGAGAVGHYAIQWAKWGGARVVTTVSSKEKAVHAKTAGPDLVLNYKTDDLVSEILKYTNNEGVDLIGEVEFGGNLDVSKQVVKANGTIAAYGSVADPEPKIPFYEMMFKGVTLRTILVYVLSDDAREAAITDFDKILNEGFFKHAIGQIFPLEEIVQAHRTVENAEAIGNVVLKIS